MGIYITMLAISLFFAGYAWRAKPYEQLRSSYITFCVLAALPFIFVTVFRYEVGTDWVVIYKGGFDLMKLGMQPSPDKGFTLIYRFFRLFTDDVWWPLAFTGLITMIFFFTAICQQSRLIPFSILVFFIGSTYFLSLTAIRQTLAMSIFLYSVKYLTRRDWKRYFLLNLIGMTFHTSSFIYLPVYFLYGFRATPRRCLGVLAALTVGYPILKILLRGVYRVTRFAHYLGGYYDQHEFIHSGFLIMSVLVLIHIFYLARFPDRDRDYEWMTWMMTAAFVMLLLSAELPGANRIATAFEVVDVLSFSIILRKEDNDRMRVLAAAAIISVLLVRFLFEVYVSGSYDAIPYKLVFFR